MPRFRIKLFVESGYFWDIEADSLGDAIDEVYDDPYVSELNKACDDDFRLDGEEIEEEEEE